MTDVKQRILKVHLSLVIVQLAFAFLPSYAKIAFKVFPHFYVALFRVTGASLIFYLIYRIFFYEKIQNIKHYVHFVVYALFGVTLNQLLFLEGLTMSTAINASILMMSIPVFTMILAIFTKQEKMSFFTTAGIIVAGIGASLIVGFDQLSFDGSTMGNILFLLNSLAFAIYLVISKPILKIYKPLTVITWVFIFGMIEIIPFSFSSLMKVVSDPPDLSEYLPLLIVLIIGTVIPYLLNTVALSQTRSSLVAVYIYLQPVFGIIIAMIVLNEKMHVHTAIAGVLVVIGVTLVNMQRYKTDKKAVGFR